MKKTCKQIVASSLPNGVTANTKKVQWQSLAVPIQYTKTYLFIYNKQTNKQQTKRNPLGGNFLA